ncbi:MAG: zinc-binding dehydrogenase [Ktedonobacteraceae bacterium]|nr:zinc-binding dehydrogenase [Ktedonobacteraceae bacterium]
MKAMILTQFGGPEVFEEREVPLPHPQAHELLVKVYATSVNPMDIQFRQGGGQWAGITAPTILGYDVSGEVAAVGEEVHDFQVGDAVYYTPDPFGQGSNAEYHVVHKSIVARKPATLSHLEAASIPLVGSTVWEALITRTQLHAGETVLIHGGAGGIGSLAVQLARAVGATVLATCSGRDSAFVQSLGADATIDYTHKDAMEQVTQQTHGVGVDVVFDAVGKELLARSIAVTKPFGRLVSIIGPTGNVNAALFKNLTIHFATCQRKRSTLDELRVLLEQERIRPTIDVVLPLHEIAQAHRRFEQGGVRGKIILQVEADINKS